jgi:hemin uptake protein HemP
MTQEIRARAQDIGDGGAGAAKSTDANTETRRIAIAGHQIDSRELFVDTREVTILHGVDVYRLRLTAQNKLILTK